jgi:hypothetical protein
MSYNVCTKYSDSSLKAVSKDLETLCLPFSNPHIVLFILRTHASHRGLYGIRTCPHCDWKPQLRHLPELGKGVFSKISNSTSNRMIISFHRPKHSTKKNDCINHIPIIGKRCVTTDGFFHCQLSSDLLLSLNYYQKIRSVKTMVEICQKSRST